MVMVEGDDGNLNNKKYAPQLYPFVLKKNIYIYERQREGRGKMTMICALSRVFI